MRAEPQRVPPKISPPPSLTAFMAILLGAAAVGAGAVVYFFNPSTHGFYPVCMFHELTGLYCPGCGGTRSVYALLHGNFRLAVKDNALFIGLLAAAILRALWFAAKRRRRQPTGEFVTPKMLWTLLVIALIFTALRNLPAFSFLSP